MEERYLIQETWKALQARVPVDSNNFLMLETSKFSG